MNPAPRIFISYRTSDGRDKAVALARDLGRVFGEAHVFLDKDDLPGGVRWSDVVHRALDARPVVLWLVTPGVLARDATQGSRLLQLASPDDPVRREIDAALAAGAQVLPVLADGVDRLPPPDELASQVGEPWRVLGEVTWRRLRAYDWASDLNRLIDDLVGFGLVPRQPAGQPAVIEGVRAVGDAQHASDSALAVAARRGDAGRQRAIVVALVLLLVAAVAGWMLWSARQPARGGDASGAGAASTSEGAATSTAKGPEAGTALQPTANPAASLAGRWQGELPGFGRVVLQMAPAADGRSLTLVSEPIRIDQERDWTDYRAFWRERFGGAELNEVMLRGEGRVMADPAQPLRIDIGVQVHPVPDAGEAIDGGNLSAALSADGRQLTGTQWRNSRQRSEAVTLTR